MPVQLTVKTKGAELVRQGLEDLDREIPKIGKRQIYDMMIRARSRLRAPAPRPTYPITWDSDKQRRAFFATDGFGHGIPYRRTGRYEAGWDVIPTPTGYRMENSWSKARYVGGDYSGQGQSLIHAGRHPLFQNVIEEEIQELPEGIEEAITYYGRSKYGF